MKHSIQNHNVPIIGTTTIDFSNNNIQLNFFISLFLSLFLFYLILDSISCIIIIQ